MELIRDGNPILHGVTTRSIGSDTVILFDTSENTIFIDAHLKEFKPPDPKKPKPDEFSAQMNNILKIITENSDKQFVLMMDANTQFIIEGGQIIAYSKDAKAYVSGETPVVQFTLEGSRATVQSIPSAFPTSYKMRGAHTAQLDKSLKPVKAIIDHIMIFNSLAEVTATDIFVLNSAKELQKVQDENTATTSPVSIADHALVISTTELGTYGTLNIKGGNTEDKAWAEFVPKEYFEFFMANKGLLTRDMLRAAFPESVFPDIPKLSSPRCGIFDINLPNELTPSVTVEGTTMHIMGDGTDAVLTNTGDQYEITGTVNSALSEWMSILLNDLNELNPDPKIKDEDKIRLREEKRRFLLEKGYALLNYWQIVQTNEPTRSVYDTWYRASTDKVPISAMVAKAKAANPLLKVLAIQELPKMLEDCSKLVKEIEAATPCTVYYHDDAVIEPTRGGIIAFHSTGGKRTRVNRIKKTRKRYNKKNKKSAKRR